MHISHRIDVLAKLTIAKGYGTLNSATVELYQVEKYQASPDPNVWTYPVEAVNDEDDVPSGSDDGFPETRTMGVSLKQAVALTPFGGGLNTHCREKVFSFSEMLTNDSDLNLLNQSQKLFHLHLIPTQIQRDILSISQFHCHSPMEHR